MFEQIEFEGMPTYEPGQSEGVLCTVFRDRASGEVTARVVAWWDGDEVSELAWRDAGPFEVDEALKFHRSRLRSLKL